MPSTTERREMRERTEVLLDKASVVLTDEERKNIEIVDYGLDSLAEVSTEIVVYVNDERYCAKELVLTRTRLAPNTAIHLRGLSGQAGDFPMSLGRGLSLCRG